MPVQLNASHSFSSSRQNPPLFVIALIVAILHLLLLGLGTFWHPGQPTPKPRSKVIVQTVRLQPIQSEVAQRSTSVAAALPTPVTAPASPLPIEQPKTEEPPIPQSITPVKKEEPLPPALDPAIQKEEILPPKLDPITLKEEALPTQETPIPEEMPIVKEEPKPAPAPKPAAPPIPIKTESKPQPKPSTPKATPQEAPKKKPASTAPIKKASEPAKQATKNEAAKPKQAEEAAKKRQQEAAEAERKRQQEIADAERKRQQEIAAAQEAARQKEQALLTKAKENLAKVSEMRDKISTSPSINLDSTALPKQIASLHVDALPLGESEGAGDWGTKETSYSEEIAYRLKMTLKLPDYGAVKIKLTLDRTGKVIKVEIIKSESHKNKTYVESKIPTLLFPSFGQKFQGHSQYTFEFLLQNDS